MNADLYGTTRRHLHGVAETLIAGPQFRAHRTIRLQARPRGFAGTTFAVAVEGTDLVWPGGRTRIVGTARDLAAAAQLNPGAPADLYADGSGLDLDEPLEITDSAAAEIAGWFTLGEQALDAFVSDTADESDVSAQDIVLWPEHFDLAVTVDEVNFGVSPGDAAHPAPYAYVAPWQVPEGDFWNVPFGALREVDEVGTRLGLVNFFVHGAAAVLADRDETCHDDRHDRSGSTPRTATHG